MTSEGRCFTFVWKLENISYCTQKEGEVIRSPVFVVNELEGTKWRLLFYPRGCTKQSNKIGCRLYREKDDSVIDQVKIDFDVSLMSIRPNDLKYNVNKGTFPKGTSSGLQILNINDLFETGKCLFLPNDTLTLRCRIWKRDCEMTDAVKCTAVTYILVEKRTVKWEIKNFSSLKSKMKLSNQVKSELNNLLLLSVDLSITEGSDSEEIISFEVSLQDKTIKFASLRLFLVNNSGVRIDCNQKKMWFDGPNYNKIFMFIFTKKNLLEEKHFYLRNDTLSLIWEWRFSKGIVSQEPVEDEHGCICSEIQISDAEESSKTQTALWNNLVDNLQGLYEERFLSDISLKTATKEFPAHKFVLSASSPVFKAMFSSHMKESINNCVNIVDLDDDTLCRMLLFIYTARVGDLTWKIAKNLYVAADKYSILNLRNQCSSFLMQNISPKRACDVLKLADSHGDAELKSYSQDYIIQNGSQISNSAEFAALAKSNPGLAIRTLCKPFK